MPVFSCTGTKWHDLWQVDGSNELAWFPGGVVAEFPEPAPIRLHVGNAAFGQIHIQNRHGHWVSRSRLSVPELVWNKLQSPGSIYSTVVDQRFNLSLRLTPQSLIVLQWRGDYFSVVSLYAHPSPLDGQWLGRYKPFKP
jgi:hypothetical protein